MSICIYIYIYADVHAYHADTYRQIESEEVVNAMPITFVIARFRYVYICVDVYTYVCRMCMCISLCIYTSLLTCTEYLCPHL